MLMDWENKSVEITDEGDSLDVSFVLDGVQVAGMWIGIGPAGDDAAYALAHALASAFATNDEAPLQGLRRGV